ncbi:MAG TPA: helix-turn-helix domain-containing protein [Bacteroidia bacterium]|jgi:transcriptional antiterminator
MKFDDNQEKLDHITKLIEHSNTGSPKDLAQQLNVSERTIRRLVEKLRRHGNPVTYSRRAGSYVLKN